MRSSRIKQVGLSDPDFFYGPEDVEFSRRIFKKEGSLIVDRNLKIYHAVTQSFVNLIEEEFILNINIDLLRKNWNYFR